MEESPSQEDSISNPAAIDSARRPWGFWWTLLFSGIISLVYATVSLLVAMGFGAAELYRNPKLNVEQYLLGLHSNGLYLSVAIMSSVIVCGALILLFAKLRRGITVSEYLRLTPVPAARLLTWLFFVAIFIGTCDVTNLMLGRTIVPKFMTETFRTAGVMPLYWLAFVIGAPLLEELFFRGFLFAGLVSSRLGDAGTIGITAFAWGAIHTQYEVIDVFTICVLGVILGLARLKTNSVYTPIALHSFTNLVATIETAMFGKTSEVRLDLLSDVVLRYLVDHPSLSISIS